jgi:hypothetical protein
VVKTTNTAALSMLFFKFDFWAFLGCKLIGSELAGPGEIRYGCAKKL